MSNVTPICDSALSRCPHIGTAQHAALVRWHGATPLAALDRALVDTPRFPLINGTANARAYAPSRGAPRPAA